MAKYYTHYLVTGKNWKGEPHETVQPFNCSQSPEFQEGIGVPKGVALTLVDRWNSMTELYEKQAQKEGVVYFRPTYSVVEPEPVLKPLPPDIAPEYVDSTEAAFELVKYGQWFLKDFESWVVKMTSQAHQDGLKEGIDWCRELLNTKDET